MAARNSFLYRWMISATGLLAAIYFVPGLHYRGGVVGFLILALIFGLVNAVLKPLLTFLTCPLVLLTLGLFLLVINALLLRVTALAGRSLGIAFYVDSFGAALMGGIIISLVSFLAHVVIRD